MDGQKGTMPKPDPLLLVDSPTQKWNTQNLGRRVLIDSCSAGCAAALVAPAVCVIDRAIIENASTGKEITFRDCLFRSLRPLFVTPHKFLFSKPFGLIFTLYFATYTTANVFDTISSTVNSKPASTTTASTTKFLATSAVNMNLSIYKDSQFAKWFNRSGASTASRSKIPMITYALFAVRDSMTIFASFNLPPLLAPKFAELPTQLAQRFDTEQKRLNAVQFLAPAVTQLFSTPIHLLGLDLYNRQGVLGFSQRFTRVTRDWLVSSFARMGRIIPAFGVGGVVNGECRRKMMPG